MNSPTWIDGLRLLVVVGMFYGAWQGYKNRPPTYRHDGKKYLALPDGRFANAWGLVLKDPVAIEALRRQVAAKAAVTVGAES